MSHSCMKTEDVLISVIVPVYNVEKYLQQCVDSILNQTHSNLEVLLVDDGSSDNSGAICRQYAQKDKRVRVFPMKNGGVSKARNTGLENAKGDWIGFVDSDDWISEETYERMLEAAIRLDADAAACKIVWERVNGTDPVIATGQTSCLEFGSANLRLEDAAKMEISLANKLIRRSFFERGIRFMEGRRFEDLGMHYDMLRYCRRIALIDEPLYHYRQRKSSFIHSESLKGWIDRWYMKKHGYEVMEDLASPELQRRLTYDCIMAANKIWSAAFATPGRLRSQFAEEMKVVASFSKARHSEVKKGNYPFYVKYVAKLTRHCSVFSYFLIALPYGVLHLLKRDDRLPHPVWEDLYE